MLISPFVATCPSSLFPKLKGDQKRHGKCAPSEIFQYHLAKRSFSRIDTSMKNALTGRLLIATPSMEDGRFKKSVILICDHDEEHAMGIVLNKAMPKLTVPSLLDQLGIDCTIKLPRTPVLDGGPCQPDRGFVLHTDDWESDDSSLIVTHGLRLTATRDVLQAIANGQKPSRATLALGYSGWSGGQLENEIRDNAWLVSDSDPDTIFDASDLKSKWESAYARLGLAPWQVSGSTGRA
jgi:putative transcriptional regulator